MPIKYYLPHSTRFDKNIIHKTDLRGYEILVVLFILLRPFLTYYFVLVTSPFSYDYIGSLIYTLYNLFLFLFFPFQDQLA